MTLRKTRKDDPEFSQKATVAKRMSSSPADHYRRAKLTAKMILVTPLQHRGRLTFQPRRILAGLFSDLRSK
jgi:hypothetical protein